MFNTSQSRSAIYFLPLSRAFFPSSVVVRYVILASFMSLLQKNITDSFLLFGVPIAVAQDIKKCNSFVQKCSMLFFLGCTMIQGMQSQIPWIDIEIYYLFWHMIA